MRFLLPLLALSLSIPSVCAEPPQAVGGLELTRVPDSLYAHVSNLPAGQGILIDKVAVGSLGERIGFKRHDILVSMGGTVLKDADHFARLLVALGDNSRVSIVRGGKEMTLALNLKLSDLPKGLVKQGGLPDVTLKAQSLGNNKHSLNLRFYTEGTGKLEEITLDGSFGEIEERIRELAGQRRVPPRVQQFVETAVQRLRTINKAPPK